MWLVAAGLLAACLAAVVFRPRDDTEDRIADGSPRPSANPTAPAPLAEEGGIAGWRNVRRELEVSGMPAFSWPLEGPPRLAVFTEIPADLLD
jgi:hypothetical protein